MAEEDVDSHELDALLREALSVAPSREFLPRVRARVERERIAHPALLPAWGAWRPAFGAAALFALIVLAVMWRPGSDRALVETGLPGPDRHLAAPSVAARTAAGSPVIAGEPAGPGDGVRLRPGAVPVRAPSRRSEGRRASRAASGAPAVEVMIDPRQQAAIGRLMELIRGGGLTAESFVAPRPAAGEVGVAPIGVVPVTVNPISSGGVLHNGLDKE